MPVNRSVAVVIQDDEGRFLTVKRDENDDSLPGVWGFPAASLRHGESDEDAVLRAGKDKLGVTLKVVHLLGDERNGHDGEGNHLYEYCVEIVDGTPEVPQRDTSVSQYVDMQYTRDPKILFEAAQKGSLCSRIYLRRHGMQWT